MNNNWSYPREKHEIMKGTEAVMQAGVYFFSNSFFGNRNYLFKTSTLT